MATPATPTAKPAVPAKTYPRATLLAARLASRQPPAGWDLFIPLVSEDLHRALALVAQGVWPTAANAPALAGLVKFAESSDAGQLRTLIDPELLAELQALSGSR